MDFPQLIAPLLESQNLSDTQARELMEYLTAGHATDAQAGAVMGMLRVKGAAASELAAFATVLRKESVGPKFDDLNDFVDTCGTGGGIPSFNISTAAAFISAAAGVSIAKHGNRGVSSKCGSADVLEALGAKIQTSWDVLKRMLQTTGLGFLYAPAHHPALQHVGKARRELGFRTVFNQLGPLANPAGAQFQLIGVYDERLVRPMAEALGRLGTRRALIAHGMDGLDEVSPVAPTRYALLWDGEISDGILTPQGFGIPALDPKIILPGDNLEQNAALLRKAVTDVDSELCTAVLPSAACALWIAGKARDRLQATEMARQTVAEGKAKAKMEEFVEESNRA
ncbi:MAG: anthranilate phosphoribosyltransferase [Armatimonadetes bacterium]|nr:anthranilate phosphoribosyltransferase [Armatimonadota bacterium]